MCVICPKIKQDLTPKEKTKLLGEIGHLLQAAKGKALDHLVTVTDQIIGHTELEDLDPEVGEAWERNKGKD